MKVNNDMEKMIRFSDVTPKDMSCQRCGYNEFRGVIQFHHIIQKRDGGDTWCIKAK